MWGYASCISVVYSIPHLRCFVKGIFPGPCPALFIDLQSAYRTSSADWWCNLQFAYILCYFIRKLRLAFVVCFGFIRDEYHIVCVDFIVALRRTKGRGRRTLRSPPSPSSGLHLIHPENPLRRGMSAAAGLYQFRYLVSGAGQSSPIRNLVWLSVFGLRSLAFQ